MIWRFIGAAYTEPQCDCKVALGARCLAAPD